MPPLKKGKTAKNKKKQQAAKKQSEEQVDGTESSTVVSGQLEKKVQRQKQIEARKRGVVFIKHLPHGFFEEQIRKYFEQFGTVTRLRLARSTRTGSSKGYAFIEFEYPEVAEIAAETMNNYLMFQKIVKAQYIPPSQQKFNYFKDSVRKVTNKAGKEIYVSNKIKQINKKVKQHNNWSEDNYQIRADRALNKLKELKEKYAHLGINFEEYFVAPQKIEGTSDTVAVENNTTPNDKDNEKPKGKKAAKSNTATEPPTKKKKTAVKKDLGLADLLGNTINEDSEDEDFNPSSDKNVLDGGESSNEDSYPFEDDKDSGDGSNDIPKKTTKKGLVNQKNKIDLINKKVVKNAGGPIKSEKPKKSVVKDGKIQKGKPEIKVKGILNKSEIQTVDTKPLKKNPSKNGEKATNKTQLVTKKSVKNSGIQNLKPDLAKKGILKSGGILKAKNVIESAKQKSVAPTKASKEKKALKLAAAKQIAKPLKSLKENPTKKAPLVLKKKAKKMK